MPQKKKSQFWTIRHLKTGFSYFAYDTLGAGPIFYRNHARIFTNNQLDEMFRLIRLMRSNGRSVIPENKEY